MINEDFEQNPYRRFRASSEDVMNAEHQQYQLTYFIKLSPSLIVNTTGYSNKFKRNWYKLDDVNLGERVSINKVLSSPEDFTLEYQTFLVNDNTQPDVLVIKANNRAYTPNGTQSIAKLKWGKNGLQTLEACIRYHEDDEDRFQCVHRYAYQNKELILTTVGKKGTDVTTV